MTERYETNARKLPWPQDLGGITAKLQREGCRAIGRMAGKDQHYEVVMEVLRVLAKHAESKLVAQKEHLVNRREHDATRTLAKQSAKLGDIELQRRNAQKDIEHLQKRIHHLDQAVKKATPAPVHTVVQLPKTATKQVAPVKVVKPSDPPPKSRRLTPEASKHGLGAPRMG
jgi:hypothetical protein